MKQEKVYSEKQIIDYFEAYNKAMDLVENVHQSAMSSASYGVLSGTPHAVEALENLEMTVPKDLTKKLGLHEWIIYSKDSVKDYFNTAYNNSKCFEREIPSGATEFLSKKGNEELRKETQEKWDKKKKEYHATPKNGIRYGLM